jgi:hypothetical protein
VKKQRKRKVGKPKKRTPVAKREFPPQTVTPRGNLWKRQQLCLRRQRLAIVVYGDGSSEPSDCRSSIEDKELVASGHSLTL